MTETVQTSPSAQGPELSDLEAPPMATSLPTLSGPPVSPQLRILGYESGEWEDFIREWATALEKSYVQLKRLGGSNDHGVDIAAFKTANGFEGPWDCFQGKHYAKELMPSDAYPEMLKVFLGVLDEHYIMPDVYAFLAPKGCGTTLDRLLSKPTDLKAKFLAELDNEKGCAKSLGSAIKERVRGLAESTDFARFQSVQLVDALDLHRKTPYHVARFGGPLPDRPPIGAAPDEVAAHEKRYVAQLIEVYEELSPGEQFEQNGLSTHVIHGDHFKRQRISFYSAEALRLHARDSVPDGTFEALQDDMHSGVVEVAEAPHATGMDRLRAVLSAATNVQFDGHAALMSVSRMDDRKGICHQLANEDRLTWVKAPK